MGGRTAQHRPDLSQLIEPGFYASLVSISRFSLLRGLGAAIFRFLSVSSKHSESDICIGRTVRRGCHFCVADRAVNFPISRDAHGYESLTRTP
jgi:hypothetical protein